MLKLNPGFVLFLLCGVALPGVSGAQSLQELELQCENERAKLIAPLRQKAIDQCIADYTSSNRGNRTRRDSREYCERYYADYGQGGRSQPGGFRMRMFHEIPECLAFYEAESTSRRR
jgi:hypothetical protein